MQPRRAFLRLASFHATGAALAMVVGGCGRGRVLHAPKAMLGSVLYVELDVIRAVGNVVEIGGSVANLGDDALWLEPADWLLVVRSRRLSPTGELRVYEIPSRGVAYVRLRFVNDGADLPIRNATLIVGGARGKGIEPGWLGEIPIAEDGFEDGPASPGLVDKECQAHAVARGPDSRKVVAGAGLSPGAQRRPGGRCSR